MSSDLGLRRRAARLTISSFPRGRQGCYGLPGRSRADPAESAVSTIPASQKKAARRPPDIRLKVTGLEVVAGPDQEGELLQGMRLDDKAAKVIRGCGKAVPHGRIDGHVL